MTAVIPRLRSCRKPFVVELLVLLQGSVVNRLQQPRKTRSHLNFWTLLSLVKHVRGTQHARLRLSEVTVRRISRSPGEEYPALNNSCLKKHRRRTWATFQVMRRTHASLMKELSIDPKLVADQQGHSLDVNLNVYTMSAGGRLRFTFPSCLSLEDVL